jgi:Family of unknown function (DUF6188)
VDEVLDKLVGAEIEQVWVWWSLRLVVDLNATYVDVTNFRFTDSQGVAHEIRVEENPEEAGIVPSVLHRTITAASISEGTVRLTFDNGSALVCPALLYAGARFGAS